MDISVYLEAAQAKLAQWWAAIPPLEGRALEIATQVQNFEVPVPDAAMLAGFLLLLAVIHRSHRSSMAGVSELVEKAYRVELLTANRRAYSARADLRKAELEIERERQRKRRLQYEAAAARKKSRVTNVTNVRAFRDRAVTRPITRPA